MLPQETFLTLQPLRSFLVASEHPVGEKLVSDIHWFPSFLIVKCWMGDVSSPVRSAKLQLVYGLNMSKTAALDTFSIQTFTCIGIAGMVGGYSQGGEQPASKRGQVPPPNETLLRINSNRKVERSMEYYVSVYY